MGGEQGGPQPIKIVRHKRNMAKGHLVHRHWCESPLGFDFGQFDVGEPSCYGCGYWNGFDEPNAPSKLERSHLVDHCRGGTGDVENLVLLCRKCNKEMPSYGPGEKHLAIAWIIARPNFFAQKLEELALALEIEGKLGDI